MLCCLEDSTEKFTITSLKRQYVDNDMNTLFTILSCFFRMFAGKFHLVKKMRQNYLLRGSTRSLSMQRNNLILIFTKKITEKSSQREKFLCGIN